MQINFILSLIAAIIVVIFAVMNSASVPVKIFFAEYEFSLALIIFICTALGAVIASMLGFMKELKLKKQVKKLTEENEKLRETISLFNTSGSTENPSNEEVPVSEVNEVNE